MIPLGLSLGAERPEDFAFFFSCGSAEERKEAAADEEKKSMNRSRART